MTDSRFSLRPFKVLAMLLYGQHKTVAWDGLSCRIRTRPFAKSIGMQNVTLRRHVQWLAKNGYITDLRVVFGWLEFTLAPPRRCGCVVRPQAVADDSQAPS